MALFTLLILSVAALSNALNCEWRYTPFQEGPDGANTAVYLDRQHPNCGTKAMIGFQLERKVDLRAYRYKYKCCEKRECKNELRENCFTEDGGHHGNPVYLDRQNVKCDNDEFLTSFHLRRDSSGNKWRYVYNCCRMVDSNVKRQCINQNTPYQTNGGSKPVYLDRHLVMCPEYFSLSRFQLRNRGSDWRYDYECCREL